MGSGFFEPANESVLARNCVWEDLNRGSNGLSNDKKVGLKKLPEKFEHLDGNGCGYD